MKNILLIMAASIVVANAEKTLRVGIIGLDTSHVTAFTEILNNPQAKDHVPGAKVVAAFKGGSKDIESSWSRVEEYTEVLEVRYGVKIYDTIEELCEHVDAVLIESVDGRPHLAQAKVVIAAKKPLYIDKPVGGTLADTLAIFKLAEEAEVPLFTSSALRFGRDTHSVHKGRVGKVHTAETTSPASLEPHHPDLYWYGVHGCETLFAVMGEGCESVERSTTGEGLIEVKGYWKGDRTGTFKESKQYGGFAIGDKAETKVGSFDGYAPLVKEIVKFFQTQQSPVPASETIELFAFMEAADESKRQNGKQITLAEVLAKARAEQK